MSELVTMDVAAMDRAIIIANLDAYMELVTKQCANAFVTKGGTESVVILRFIQVIKFDKYGQLEFNLK